MQIEITSTVLLKVTDSDCGTCATVVYSYYCLPIECDQAIAILFV